MKIINHWLNQAIKRPSPNFEERPIEMDISLIVIHNISLPPGQFEGTYIDQLFCNQLDPEEHPYFKQIHHLKVSSHLLIRRCGEIVQYVAFNKRAWHAGLSEYKGRARCNDFSIGIELEGTDHDPYTNEQYEQLTQITQTLVKSYPNLNTTDITGHSNISPGRKTDPGEVFDWNRFLLGLEN